MAHLDLSTGYVRAHLQNNPNVSGFGLHVQTEPGLHGRAVTTIRQAVLSIEWSEQRAQALVKVLEGLPGANVALSRVRNLITVVWEGVR